MFDDTCICVQTHMSVLFYADMCYKFCVILGCVHTSNSEYLQKISTILENRRKQSFQNNH